MQQRHMQHVWTGGARDPRNNPLGFGGHPDHGPDSGIFKMILYLLLQFLLQTAKIKHENRRRKFELSECFLALTPA